MSGKLKSPEITILSNWSQLHAENYRTHPSNLGLHFVAYSKNRINFLTSKRSNFGKIDLKLLPLGFRWRFKFSNSFKGGCFDCDKNSTTTSIRPISPKYCKARMQYFRVADIFASLTHITSEFSAYARSRKRWRLRKDCQFIVLSL